MTPPPPPVTLYYINTGDRPDGPYTLDEICCRPITPDTLIWREGMTGWHRADEIYEISRRLWGASPGAAPARPVSSQAYCPSTYLVPSVLLTLCCCNPVAIVAIVYALQVEPAWSRGQIDRAADASHSAKQWCVIAAIVWVVIAVMLNYWVFPMLWSIPATLSNMLFI